MNHVCLWPVQSLVLGSPVNHRHTYAQNDLVTILMLRTQGDASIICCIV